MFKALRRNLKKKGNKAPVDDGNFITNAGRIASILGQAKNAHILFNASFKEHSHPFNTAVIKVNEEQRYIILDEITPKQSHELLLAEKQIRLFGYLNGVELSFETDLLEEGIHEGIRFYKMALPEQLFYLQRRSHHRVPTTGMHIPFQASRSGSIEHALKGYLSDLSQSGAGIILDEAVYLPQGDTLRKCTITLPDEDGEVVFTLEVRFTSKPQYRRRCRLGGKFKELDRESRNKITQIINQLERAQLKRLRGS